MIARSPAAARVVRVLGVVLLLASPVLAFGVWFSTREPRQLLATINGHRAPGDSAAYLSAVYHAARADAVLAARWSPTGFATLGTIGFVCGIALLVYGATRRTGYRTPDRGR